ncbi:MAG: ABC transporter permease [Planctomycetes bacterium]|nr:ABC transporter permease [Planctomycetota bacterium]
MSPSSNEDRTLLRHAGLPFFFRHTPALALRRGAFWLGFALVAVVTSVDLLLMPYPRGTLAANLRGLVFDRPGFRDFEEGLRAIFDQYFVAALILSGIVSPLYATYSMAMERVGGTIEFLRLSPMSTLSVVLGKMFAPAYMLQLFSGGLLFLGTVFGIAGGHAPGDVALALLSIITACLTVHALGGLLACATTTFRGFGAVMSLVGLGILLYSLPNSFSRTPGLGYLQYVSPFSAMNALFWSKGAYSRWSGYVHAPDEFLGYGGLVAPFVLCFHGLVVTMLVWAATRWLDHPEDTALPKKAWGFLLLSALAMALGTVPNNDGGLSANFFRIASGVVPAGGGEGFFTPSVLWQYATVIFLVLGVALAILASLDHPHRRELALEEACERQGNRTQGSLQPWRRLAHGLFVSTFAAVVVAVSFGFFHRYGQVGKSYAATTVALGTALVFWVVFFASLAIECSWIRFRASGGRAAAAAVAVSLLLTSVGVPIVNVAQANNEWRRARQMRNKSWVAEAKVLALEPQIAALEALPPDQVVGQAPVSPSAVAPVITRQTGTNGMTVFVQAPATPQPITVAQQLAEFKEAHRNQKRIYGRQMADLVSNEALAPYVADMTSQKALAHLDAEFSDAPLAIIWRYHRGRFLWYPIGLVAVCALIFFLRAWTYRGIEQEARTAMAAVEAPDARWAPAPPRRAATTHRRGNLLDVG